jgi:peptidoglycan/LPS O-acetylase OafA/YrhL
MSAVLYVSNYYVATHTLIGGLTHTWSLSVEEQFYVLWPLAFVALRRRRSLVTLLGATAIAVQVWRFGGVLLRANPYYLEFAFDMRCDALVVGCLLALASGPSALQARLRAVNVRRLALSLSLAIIALTTWAEIAHRRLAMAVLFGPVAVAFGVVIVSVSVMRAAPTPVLDSRVLRYIGRISYGLYLYHVLVFNAIPRGVPVLWRLVIGGVGTFLIASASYHCVEAPILNLGRPRRRPVPRADWTPETFVKNVLVSGGSMGSPGEVQEPVGNVQEIGG